MRLGLGVVVLGLLTTFMGCATMPHSSGMPCEDCKYGVRSVGRAAPARVFCVVNGREVDCHKNPAECPECSKAASGK